LLHNVAKRLASYKVPEDLQVLKALPRNALSKVDRNALQAMVREEKGALTSSDSDGLSALRIA
jgi:long-chain acyl-CoA synthetase